MPTEEPSIETDEKLAEVYLALATQRFAGELPCLLARLIAQFAVLMRRTPTPRFPQLRYRSAEEFLLREGLAFRLKEPQRNVTMGERKQCFRNCYKRAVFSRRYAYCEGMALGEPGHPPYRHAWLLDLTDGLAFDPTWRTRGDAYIGVVIDEAYLAAVFPRAGCVIENVQARWPILTGAAGHSWRHRWLADRL